MFFAAAVIRFLSHSFPFLLPSTHLYAHP
ncbi:hypothetical protein C802_01851, partial [Phocaeicola sartorii]